MTSSKPTSPANPGPAQPKSTGGDGKKAERLASALRDNLRRRKTQQRERQDGESAAVGKPAKDDTV